MQGSATTELERGTLSDFDMALAEGLRDRSPESCRELYRRFAIPLHRFITHQVGGDVEAAQEILVETFAAAAQDIRHFDPRRSTLSAWLYGIARRRVQDELRRRHRRKSVPMDMLVPLESVQESSNQQDLAGDVAAQVDAQRKVAALAEVLSECEMTTLMLSYIEDLSIHEIGHIIGRSERAVHSILHRARQKARERLVDCDV